MSTRERLRVVIAGGGFAGVEAVLALRALAGERVDIELVSASDSRVYRPHAVREPFGLGDAEHIPLRPLCDDHRATLRTALVTGVDVAQREVQTDRYGALSYDVLLVATGARPEPAVADAITFDGRRGVAEMRRLLQGAAEGHVRMIAFVVPDAAAWTLPLYELAFLTHAHLRQHGAGTRLAIVTPENEPLGTFGTPASDRVRTALAARGISMHPPEELRALAADAVVALPRFVGPRLTGLPSTADGFLPVDDFGLVRGTTTVYAAGDVTDHVLKQGGLAAQQAEVSAAHIAAGAGAAIHPRPFAPILRGLLLTGGLPWHLLGGPHPDATARPLWPSLGKVIGTRLATYLGVAEPADRPQGMELALMLADEAAADGDPGAALEWLSTAEAIGADLPGEYEQKRLTWTFGSTHSA
jgi:sulfide:quinone oxidoreductase